MSDCGPGTLAALCDEEDCPSSASEVFYQCSEHEGAASFTSSCSGLSVAVTDGDNHTVWHFGSEGQLIGVKVTRGDGSCTRQYGAWCEMAGGSSSLCPMADSCAAHPLEDLCVVGSRKHPCPTLADACGDGPDVDVSRSSCGGYFIRSDHGTNVNDYSFDADGVLIGARYFDDVPHSCGDARQAYGTTYGVICEEDPSDFGPRPTICSDLGDTGGAGGAPADDGGAAGQSSGGETN